MRGRGKKEEKNMCELDRITQREKDRKMKRQRKIERGKEGERERERKRKRERQRQIERQKDNRLRRKALRKTSRTYLVDTGEAGGLLRPLVYLPVCMSTACTRTYGRIIPISSAVQHSMRPTNQYTVHIT